MDEPKLDITASKEDQLKILVPYLENIAGGKKDELPITLRARTLIGRYLWHWTNLYNSRGITPLGAFLYYRRLIEK